MLATELKRIIKDSVIIFIILAALGTAIINTNQDDYLAPALEIFLLLYASYTGWSLFEREKQEKAEKLALKEKAALAAKAAADGTDVAAITALRDQLREIAQTKE